jgi:serine phosphatase RsbU (regulator of sigma subunit)
VSLLLVVDPLEELFTLAASDERTRFFSLLEALQAEPHCVTIFALRADFYGDFMESPLWARRSGRLLRVEVGPLRGERLREAITRPALALGVRVEDALIERLLADAAAEPGSLPLLQETLAQLWDRRQGPALALADYQALGDGGRSGLAVTLARRADAVLRTLPPEREVIARRIVLRLVSFGEGRSDTRRQQPRSRLRAAGEDRGAFDDVLRQLIAGRLLVTDDDGAHDPCVDLAHEAMITAWPTLAGWIAARRRDEQRRRQLEAAVAHWVERGRGAGGLLDPVELAEVEVWRRTEGARDLGELAGMAELIAASAAARARQDQLQRDLETARKIQRSLLPAHPPDVLGLDFAIHYEPARQLGVDFYDFLWHDGAHLGLVVGKVVGTPVSAALYIVRLTAELRAYAAITGDSPARLLRRVNQQIADLDEDGIFAPLVYCVYSLGTRYLEFTNAGHCVPLVRRGDHVFQLHAEQAHAPPLGVTPDYEAGDGSVQLQPGDMLVIASYGILETRDAHGNDYGISRLARRLATARGAVGDVLGEIVAEIHSHRGAPGQSEADMTLLAMSVGERPAEPVPATLKGRPPRFDPEPEPDLHPEIVLACLED